jgi:hypothetical protein
MENQLKQTLMNEFLPSIGGKYKGIFHIESMLSLRMNRCPQELKVVHMITTKLLYIFDTLLINHCTRNYLTCYRESSWLVQ